MMRSMALPPVPPSWVKNSPRLGPATSRLALPLAPHRHVLRRRLSLFGGPRRASASSSMRSASAALMSVRSSPCRRLTAHLRYQNQLQSLIRVGRSGMSRPAQGGHVRHLRHRCHRCGVGLEPGEDTRAGPPRAALLFSTHNRSGRVGLSRLGGQLAPVGAGQAFKAAAPVSPVRCPIVLCKVVRCR